MDWLKGADKSVKIAAILVCGIAAIAVLAAYVVLTINGADTSEFRQWIIGIANLVVLPFTGIAAVASVSAANHAKRAEDNSNGVLKARDRQIDDLSTTIDTRDHEIDVLRRGGNGSLP